MMQCQGELNRNIDLAEGRDRRGGGAMYAGIERERWGEVEKEEQCVPE